MSSAVEHSAKKADEPVEGIAVTGGGDTAAITEQQPASVSVEGRQGKEMDVEKEGESEVFKVENQGENAVKSENNELCENLEATVRNEAKIEEKEKEESKRDVNADKSENLADNTRDEASPTEEGTAEQTQNSDKMPDKKDGNHDTGATGALEEKPAEKGNYSQESEVPSNVDTSQGEVVSDSEEISQGDGVDSVGLNEALSGEGIPHGNKENGDSQQGCGEDRETKEADAEVDLLLVEDNTEKSTEAEESTLAGKSPDKENDDSSGSGFVEKGDASFAVGEKPEREAGDDSFGLLDEPETERVGKVEDDVLDESKESWVDGNDGDDGFQEAEEPMETDEFDEVERAVKEERGLSSLPLETVTSTAEGESKKGEDGESTPKDMGDATESKIEDATTDSTDRIQEKEEEASQGSVNMEEEEKMESKDPLTESQEMLMQYDGEDLIETMVSDSSVEDSEKQNQTGPQEKKLAKSKDEEVEAPMEVDSAVPSETASESADGGGDPKESVQQTSVSDSKDEGSNSREKDEETDVIDMIEERTVSPSLHTKKDVAIGNEGKKCGDGDKEDSSSDVIVLDDTGPKKSDEEGEKSKETTPTTEKKRKLASLGSIVSRLTQSIKEKQSEESGSKSVLDKSIPVISQVKTLSTEPPKEKVGRKQVYKTEEVVNRCSVCFQPFLSLNPIKFNNNVFCSDDCLHEKKGASSDNTLCSYCKKVFKKDSPESCSIELGMQRKRFCSSTCKSDYQKKVKPCSNCGEDITGTSNAFMAQVGSEGKFMEFCSQGCVESYEKKLKDQPAQTKDCTEKKACSMCRKITAIKHEVKFRGSYYHMCGADCFSNFRKKYNLSLRTCNQCGTTCYNEHSPGDDKDGHKVFFCSQKCLEVFQQSRSLSEPCFSCKTMYKQGMFIEGKGSNGKIYKFCSQECLQKVLPSSTSSTSVPTVTPTSTLKTTSVVPSQGPLMTTQVQTSKPSVQPRIVQSSNSSTASGQNQGSLPCNHCKKLQRPLYHLTMSDSSLRNFCSYPCVIAFQAQFNVPPVTLPQETLLLRCGQCHRGFSHRPQTLDYQGETRLFCSTSCLDDFKRTQSIIAICDCCFEEKILFEETNFLGKARYFCSPGCSLIFKNQFVKRIGLRCAMCDYCSTMCKVATVSVLGGSKKRFCAEECKESYHQWYNKMARCEGCKRMGCELTESFRWRGKVKRVCNEQCLLLFYTQQNVPDMGTQLQSELNPPVKPSENGTGSFPTITNVKSLAGPQVPDATHVKHIPMAHKQTQITTNTIFVKPPPPPPMPPPPAPKQVRNKMTLCKPYAVSKAVTCKPITADEGTQADLQPVLVPIPVPIFVPVPMQMYTSPVPHPVGIPIPIPTPMFVPVAYSDCDSLMESIENIRNTIPSDPLEADILMMATAIAGKEESSRKPAAAAQAAPMEEPPTADDISDLLPLEDSEVLDIPNKFLETDSDIAGILADSLEAIDTVDLFPEERVTRSSSRVTRNSSQLQEEGEGPSTRRTKTRGAKRVCLDGDDDEDAAQSPGSCKEDVRPDIGPAAYSFFLQQMSKDGEPQNEKLKANLSLASVDELHYCLCRFVREARQPDGEVYPADTLFLILLSIQKYLMTNKRKENIFMDHYFQTFSNLLHERIGEHSIIMDPMVGIEPGSTCLDEEFLWDSKQLGAHSPSVLLSTILYYCTKELMLKTVAMHQELAFCRVQRLVRKDSRGKREAYIRFLPSEEQRLKESAGRGKKRSLDIDFSLELHVNNKHPLRCPIKLYEFYLSKCPESVRTSRNVFYLVPERACVPDSPLWYSDKPLPDKTIERYLWRHLIVRDIHEHWEMLRMKKEAGDSSDCDES